MDNILKIPVWIINHKTAFKKRNRFYACSIGNGFDIFINLNSLDYTGVNQMLSKEVEPLLIYRLDLLINTRDAYRRAYVGNKNRLFSQESDIFPEDKQELWELLKSDIESFNHIEKYISQKYLTISKLTYGVFCKYVSLNFIEIDVSWYENKYIEILNNNPEEYFFKEKFAEEQQIQKNKRRKIAAGVLCPECSGKNTMVIQLPYNNSQEARISCRDCGNSWSIQPLSKNVLVESREDNNFNVFLGDKTLTDHQGQTRTKLLENMKAVVDYCRSHNIESVEYNNNTRLYIGLNRDSK